MPTRKQTISNILGSFQIIRRTLLREVAERQTYKEYEDSVTLAQQMTLLTVAARGTMSVKEIASTRMISSSAATQVVDTLVKKGYLVRSQNDKDRRTTVVALGPEYQQKIDEHRGDTAAYLTPIFSALTKEELEEYERLNTKLIDSLRKKYSQ